MTDRRDTLRPLSTPRAAAVAGVLFAVLFGTALVMLRTALPADGSPGAQWVDGAEGRVRVAVILMPFAGVMFLWFLAVVRDGLGALEDRFFATVFLGSGLVFLALVFTSTAVGAGLLAGRRLTADAGARTEMDAFGQGLLTALSDTYALRMAAVFMMSLGTIWWRTRLMPTWLVVLTYLVALSVLAAVDVTPWLTLAFPVWVLVVSVTLLARPPVSRAGPAPPTGTG